MMAFITPISGLRFLIKFLRIFFTQTFFQKFSGRYIHDNRGQYIPDNRGLYVHIPGPDGPPALPYVHVIGPFGPNGPNGNI